MSGEQTLAERRLSKVRFSLEGDEETPGNRAPMTITTHSGEGERGRQPSIELPAPTPYHMLPRSLEVNPMDQVDMSITHAPAESGQHPLWASGYRGFQETFRPPAVEDLSPRSAYAPTLPDDQPNDYRPPDLPAAAYHRQYLPEDATASPPVSPARHSIGSRISVDQSMISPPPATRSPARQSGTPTVMVTPMSPPQHGAASSPARPIRRTDSEMTLGNDDEYTSNSRYPRPAPLNLVGATHADMHHAPDPAGRRLSPASSSGHSSPIKPALKRTRTQEEVAREAARLVQNQVSPRHAAKINAGVYAGRRDEEDVVPAGHAGGKSSGVLSNLLQLHGRDGLRKRSNSTGSLASTAASRSPSTESAYSGHKRRTSDESVASTLVNYRMSANDDGSKSDDDGKKRRRSSSSRSGKPGFFRRFSFASEYDGEDSRSVKSSRRRSSLSFLGSSKQRRASITRHVADILLRQDFILKLAKALMTFGAPSHRIESQLNAVADVLEVDAQFVHLPNIVIASFGDTDTHTTETHFVKANSGLDLGLLTAVHEIYKLVTHDEIGVLEGSAQLSAMLKAKPIYRVWQRILIAAVCAGVICPLGFSGSFVDGCIAALFGALLAFLQLRIAAKNAMYSNIFEISIATIVSFSARGLSATNIFCYQAISSAGVVLVLPGYVILCGSLELASRNLVAGSVKLVYAIIYSLFLGFGLSIGSELFLVFDPSLRTTLTAPPPNTYSIVGTLIPGNGTFTTMQGVFTFTNTTLGDVYDATAALRTGSVSCYRDPEWPWWRQSITPYWMFLLVPAFSCSLSLWVLQPFRDRQFFVGVFIACAGFAANYFANNYVVSFIGSFVIGLLGNLYSRIFQGTAFTAMVTGVLFLVPSGVAAAGGLAITYASGSDSYSNGLTIGFRMVQVAIGITVGLFLSSFVVYSVGGKRKRTSLFSF